MDLRFLNKKNFDKYDPDLKARIQPKVLSYNTDTSGTSWPKLAIMPVCMVLAASIFTVGIVILSNRGSTPGSDSYSSSSETVFQTDTEIVYTGSNTNSMPTPGISSASPSPTYIVSDADFKDVIGVFSTSFLDSESGRKTNISIATETINGTILMPGERFSFNDEKHVGDTTMEKGYKMGVAYELGNVVQTYGSGICQVSTTLYNAVIRAGLEVVTRSSHSMTVGYIDRGMDAAVAYGAKDFVFKNNLDVPVKIVGEISDSKVTFKIYGINQNKNTQYSFTAKKVDQFIEGGKTYYVYQSYRTVTVDGQIIEENKQFAKSTYLVENQE